MFRKPELRNTACRGLNSELLFKPMNLQSQTPTLANPQAKPSLSLTHAPNDLLQLQLTLAGKWLEDA